MNLFIGSAPASAHDVVQRMTDAGLQRTLGSPSSIMRVAAEREVARREAAKAKPRRVRKSK